MSEDDRLDSEERWRGFLYIILGPAAMLVFVFYGDTVDTGEIVASVAIVMVGVGTILAPRISTLLNDLDDRWTGLVWALCGFGISSLGVVAASTTGQLIGGVVLGGGLVIYGVLIALGR